MKGSFEAIAVYPDDELVFDLKQVQDQADPGEFTIAAKGFDDSEKRVLIGLGKKPDPGSGGDPIPVAAVSGVILYSFFGFDFFLLLILFLPIRFIRHQAIRTE
jgi:hypothetical protein